VGFALKSVFGLPLSEEKAAIYRSCTAPRMATIGNDDRLIGHIFIHQVDDSGFICERE
jgi:hypothetical protein